MKLSIRERLYWDFRDWWHAWGRVAIPLTILLLGLLLPWACLDGAEGTAVPSEAATPASAPVGGNGIHTAPLPGDYQLPPCPGECSARARFVLAPESPAPAAGAPATFDAETIPWAVLPSGWIEAPRLSLVSFEELARPDLAPGREPLWAEVPGVTHETYAWGIRYIETPTSPVPEPAMWVFLLVGVPFAICSARILPL